MQHKKKEKKPQQTHKKLFPAGKYGGDKINMGKERLLQR